jgi:rubrerythrin
MLSTIPVDLKKVKKEDIDKSICRVGMIAELDASSFYEQLAAMTSNNDIKKTLLDISKEEKTHMAEFETLLLRFDKELAPEMEHGKEEVRNNTGK